MTVITVCATVREFAAVEEPDERRARHADEPGGLFGGEIIGLVYEHFSDRRLERLDNVGTQLDLMAMRVDQPYAAAEQGEELLKFTGVRHEGHSRHKSVKSQEQSYWLFR